MVVLAVVIFLFDNLREKRSMYLLHVLKILVAHQLEITALKEILRPDKSCCFFFF